MAAAGVWLAMCMGTAALGRTTVTFGCATAACSPAEIAWLVVAAGIVHRIAPVVNNRLCQRIWSMTRVAASIVAPVLVGCALPHDGRLMLALSIVALSLPGAVLRAPLARSVPMATSAQ